jgi:hypothetical protein
MGCRIRRTVLTGSFDDGKTAIDLQRVRNPEPVGRIEAQALKSTRFAQRELDGSRCP